MRCPICDAESPDGACACGGRPTAPSGQPPINYYTAPPRVSGGGARDVVIGGLWCAGGTIATVWSYQAAASDPHGGHYVVAWGAILFGAVQLFRGLAKGL